MTGQQRAQLTELLLLLVYLKGLDALQKLVVQSGLLVPVESLEKLVIGEFAKVVSQSLFDVFFEELANQASEGLRRPQMFFFDHVVIEDVEEEVALTVSLEWILPIKHQVENHSQGPKVRFLGPLLLFNDFGSQITHCSLHLVVQ